ncbi:MAG: hypothetical protein K2L78_08265 [Muribaculaceae bacterium]|nr:hypothetical protein [Muribaculaceae bacterium]
MKALAISTIIVAASTAIAAAGTPAHRANPATTPDGTQPTTLLVCGSTYVSAVRPDLIPNGTNYLDGIIWDFDARDVCYQMGLSPESMDHLDDCKPIDGNTRILATSSHHWSVIINYATKQIEFWTTKSDNAHSAEVLPGNKIVVACSSPCDKLQLYDRSRNNEVLHTVDLPSAHGVVWNEKRQRLYAIGKKKLGIYRLEGADTDTPTLVEEASVTTPKTGTHDLTPVDENTLCVSGRNSYFFDIDTKEFTELTQFNGRTAIKSVNYNLQTNEAWYTDSTEPEGDYSWSTQTVHHTPDPMGTADDYTFRTKNFNLYKVRVLYWGGENSGVEAVTSDHANAPAEYFNLQGIRVDEPSGGIFIRRQNNVTEKVLIP